MKLVATKENVRALIDALKRAPSGLRMARDACERGAYAQAVQICGEVLTTTGRAAAQMYEGGATAVDEVEAAAHAVANKHSGGASS